MADLKTTYLGLELKNPLVASPSPLSEKLDNVRRMEDNGIAAVVFYSLFEEQIIHDSLELDHFLNQGTESFAEALTYLPEAGRYSIGPEKYLNHLSQVKKAVGIPVIGSLNGVSTGGWIDYAAQMEQAGADALELNIYYLPTDVNLTSTQLEDAYAGLVANVRTKVKIPIAVKLSPYFTAFPNMARRLAQAGADGLVLFNRFYQPDYDLETLEVVHNLELSTSYEMRLPLRWIALLYGRIQVDFALTTGVHSATDALKGIMAGASVTMMTSELLSRGVERPAQILADMGAWLDEHEYISVKQMKGSMSQRGVADPAALERANYMKVLSSWKALP